MVVDEDAPICGRTLSHYLFREDDPDDLTNAKHGCFFSLWCCSCCCVPDLLAKHCCSNSVLSYLSIITIIIVSVFLLCVCLLSFINTPSIESFTIQFSIYTICLFILIAFGMGMPGWKDRIQFEQKKKGLFSLHFGQSNYLTYKFFQKQIISFCLFSTENISMSLNFVKKLFSPKNKINHFLQKLFFS